MNKQNMTHEIIGQYVDWLSENLRVREDSEGRLYIETPFARADGHHFEIEVCPLGKDRVRLSDGGDTLDELWMQGVELSPGVLSEIEALARQFRVCLDGDDLSLTVSGDGGARQVQDLISAILVISSTMAGPLGKMRTRGA